MPLVTKPYNYANGQTIDANQLNQDLDTLYNLINGLLDAVNIAANGLNDPNKFAAEVITQAKSKGLVYTQDLYGQSWVVSGGVTTASGSPANQITVTTLIANILQADGSYRHVTVAGTTYVTSIINATYYLELQPDGTMNWSQTHSAQANYMPIATVTSDGSGNILLITDNKISDPSLRSNTKNGLNGQAIINGNFDVWQRGTNLTLASATVAYLADRFISNNNTSGVNSTLSRVAITDLDGSVFGLQFVHAALPTNQGRLQNFYTIKAADSYKLAGKTVTFSVKVKGVLAMNQITVFARYNTTETGITGSSTFLTGVTNAIINNATWTIVTFNFTFPSRATLTSTGVVGFQIASSKTTAEASGDGFIIAQAQLNIGSIALPFQPRTFDEELAMCLPYYEKSYDYGVTPATASSTNGIEVRYVGTSVPAGTRYGSTNFKVKKRTVPTVTVYPLTTPTNTSRVSDHGGVDLAANSGVPDLIGENRFDVTNNSGTTLSLPNAEVIFHWSADAEL